MLRVVKVVALVSVLQLIFMQSAFASDAAYESFHFGIMHPNGVDLIGYSIEKSLSASTYFYYTFGYPSIAAMGLNFYANHIGQGLVTTLGLGVGSVLYGSLAYQIYMGQNQNLIIGAGLTASIVYSGVYPVISYERRF